jgi:hypothetical protein
MSEVGEAKFPHVHRRRRKSQEIEFSYLPFMFGRKYQYKSTSSQKDATRLGSDRTKAARMLCAYCRGTWVSASSCRPRRRPPISRSSACTACPIWCRRRSRATSARAPISRWSASPIRKARRQRDLDGHRQASGRYDLAFATARLFRRRRARRPGPLRRHGRAQDSGRRQHRRCERAAAGDRGAGASHPRIPRQRKGCARGRSRRRRGRHGLGGAGDLRAEVSGGDGQSGAMAEATDRARMSPLPRGRTRGAACLVFYI